MPNKSLGELFTDAISTLEQMHIHICSSGEYNSSTHVPTIVSPDEQTIYMVPSGSGTNLYDEYVYVNNGWEMFGSGNLNLNGYATETFVTTRVPAPPVSDGNYILKVNVSSSTATYSWVALSDLSGVTF